MKPPCMLAHRVISAASASGGERPRSRATRSPAVHAAAIGSASTCGRASRLAVNSPRPRPTVATERYPKLARRAQAHDERRGGCRGAGHEHDPAPNAKAEGERQQALRTAIRGQPTARPASNG